MVKILFLDIETAPHKVYTFQLWNAYMAPDHMIEPSYTLCWAAKWFGKSQILFDSIERSSPKEMLKGIWKLLDEADIVVHFYGKKFDIPTLNKEFINYGLVPPSPYKQIDLKDIAAKVFKFASNKLEFVAKFLKVGCKIKTDFDLWLDVMEGKKDAWQKMKTYNKQDTNLLEKVYLKMRPWIPNHPNLASYAEDMVCPTCGGSHYIGRGYYYLAINKYHKYQCKDCFRYFRGNKLIAVRKGEKFVNIVN